MERLTSYFMDITKFYKNKRVLITGHTGFKGAWLTLWLQSAGAHVYGVSDNFISTPSLFQELELENKIEHIKGNINDHGFITSLISKIKPEFVFHLAAQAIVSESYKNPIQTFETNALGTANILDGLRLSNHECTALIITSDKSYKNKEWIWGYRETDELGGKDPYSASKSLAEIITRSYYESYFKEETSKVKVISVRAGNVIGGGDWAKDRLIPDSINAWNKKSNVILRNPHSTRPWLFVLDVLNGYLAIAKEVCSLGLNGEAFNFGPNYYQNSTVIELITELSKHYNNNESLITIQDSNKAGFNEANALKLNGEKVLNTINWKPKLELSECIKYTSDWYKNHYAGKENCYDYSIKQLMDFIKL